MLKRRNWMNTLGLLDISMIFVDFHPIQSSHRMAQPNQLDSS